MTRGIWLSALWRFCNNREKSRQILLAAVTVRKVGYSDTCVKGGLSNPPNERIGLIWSDPVNLRDLRVCWSLLLCFFEDKTSSSRSSFKRRLISLIFAGRNRIILIRRELPLTVIASPAEPVAYAKRGFSFVLASAAADSVLELWVAIHRLVAFGFSFLGGFLLFLRRPLAAQRLLPPLFLWPR